ncbi:hypothetical protein [Luteibacter sp. UNCMF366Tsu5.1]|uniref:hypothetical protein n=1 Tax=Luteibacter sp. UNCMF366Tsu5.1 TaxID=1502758 RepID=UPI000908F1AB|nr:hypothetical protein [Luteibacter sp. UNCMF366Tsu5.1]SFW75807.1 hypothetical protein SAMN02800691_3589 [Luteibacter sp. UNCMF366Tsu5.1]
MRYGYALPIAGVCVCFMAGCASSPSLVYKTFPADGTTKSSIVRAGTGHVDDPATTQPTDPADGEFAMAKQVSTVVLSLPESVAKARMNQAAQGAHGPNGDGENTKAVGKDKGKKQEPAPQVVPPAEPMKLTEVTSRNNAPLVPCGDAKNKGEDKSKAGWMPCFEGVQTATAPHVDMSYVFAVRQARGTNLDVTTGTHPLQVTAVTSKWTNTTAAMLARIGSEAALGYAAAGPIGAAVVVIGGEVGGLAAPKGGIKERMYLASRGHTWKDAVNEGYVCQGEDPTEPKPMENALLLPVAMDLDNSLPSDDTSDASGNLPKYAGCWHRFPKGDALYTNQNWLYRVLDWTDRDGAFVNDPTVQLVPPVLDERKPGASASKLGIVRSDRTSGLISQAEADAIANSSPDEAWIPASACHAVRLQVTHANEVIAASGWISPPGSTGAAPQERARQHHDVQNFKDFDIVIADPRWNQLMRVTKGTRTITFGQCGGTAKGTQGSSEIADDVKAAAELVKTVKGLQASSGKSGQ